MGNRRRILFSSVLLMTGGMFCSVAVTLAILYQTTLEDEREELAEIARGQARFMEAVARFDAINSQGDHPGGARAATLSQITAAHDQYPGFGETGELVVAQREGDQIVFLFPYRYGDGSDPDPIPWRSELAEPMRLALSGQEGTLIGLDYRGERVLAAYHPVAVLDLGVVAKSDVAETRAPFVMAALTAGGVTVVLVLVGAGLTLRVTDPLVRHLQESESKFRTLYDSTSDAVMLLDEKGFFDCNVATLKVFGCTSREEFCSKHPADLSPPIQPCGTDSLALADQRISTAFKEGTNRFEWMHKHADGTELPAEVLLNAMTLGNRSILQAVVRDISDRKRIEDRLNEALACAEAATNAKSEFLANMSHEIRTPMTAILGFAENLLDSDQSESEKLNAIHTIHRNGENLLSIINDILDLSKIEAGKMDVERTACEPCRIVADVASLMRVRADEKRLPLKIEYMGAIPETIRSDPGRLRQILINLIGNAIKFTNVGDVRLVTRFVNDNDVPRLQFDVIDTGSGMTEEQVAKLFQPFTQADTSTTRKFGGTGLGLTISKRFAEMLGGDIAVVETKTDVGTTVCASVSTGSLVGVKMLQDPMSATVVADTADGVARVLPSDLHGLHILLAEDGPDNQRLISFVLKKAGADVTVEENGKFAVDAALAARDEGRPFDVILMDMQMPVMDGYEATGLLRQKGYTAPIIALTAHAMASDREKCIKAGCDDYATKPIDRKKLIETLQVHLQPTAVSAST